MYGCQNRSSHIRSTSLGRTHTTDRFLNHRQSRSMMWILHGVGLVPLLISPARLMCFPCTPRRFQAGKLNHCSIVLQQYYPWYKIKSRYNFFGLFFPTRYIPCIPSLRDDYDTRWTMYLTGLYQFKTTAVVELSSIIPAPPQERRGSHTDGTNHNVRW